MRPDRERDRGRMSHPEEKTCALFVGDVVFRRADNGWIVITIDAVSAEDAAHDYCRERYSAYEADRDTDEAMKEALRRAVAEALDLYMPEKEGE